MNNKESEMSNVEEAMTYDRFAQATGLKKWLIPLIAFVIVLVTFAQLATAFNRAQTRVRSWRNDREDDQEMSSPLWLDDLSNDLREITIALHYEMMFEVEGEAFDPLQDIVQMPYDLRGISYIDMHGEWIDFASLEASQREEIISRQLSNRILAVRSRLSTLASAHQVAYLAIHDDGGMITSRHSAIEELIDGEITFDLIHELSEQFAHVIVVRYNHHGRWEIPFLLADETEDAIHRYLNQNGGRVEGLRQIGRMPSMTSLTYQFDLLSERWHIDEYEGFTEWEWEGEWVQPTAMEWQNPRNMTFVYGIPHDIFTQLVRGTNLPQTSEIDADMIGADVWWEVWRHVDLARTLAVWLIAGIAITIPLRKVKEADKGFKLIRKMPIEAIMIATAIAWILVANNLNLTVDYIADTGRILTRNIITHQNAHIVYFHVLIFVAIAALGYLIYYLKDISASKGKTLQHDSMIYQLFGDVVAVDLKRSQSLRIFILVFGQVLVGCGLILMALFMFPDHPLPFLFFILIPLYLGSVFLYIRYKVAKIRQDYIRLFEITQKLANGDLEVNQVDNLGYFDSLKDELVTIQNGFGLAVERALASERMKGDLITNVSHDLKTPLTSIITYVDLLKVEGLSEEKRQHYLKTLELKTDRLKTLIEDLFEVSKASSGNLQLEVCEVDVITLMKQTVLGLEDRLKESGLTLRENYPEESIKMNLDGGRMHRVFENLIINITKYAMPHTRAYIDIFQTDSHVTIILRNISNHEINVDMNDLSERFIRGETSRTTEGSGLGLAIAKSFVELQGGTFEITVDGDLFKVIMTFEKVERL